MSEQIPDIIAELRVLLWRGSRDIGARAEILAEVRDLRLHILSSPPDQDVDDIGRLAVLLESAGCPSEAESLLADAVTASSYRPLARATLLNHRGMLASLRGQPGEAAAFFEDALFTRGLDSLELVCRLQTNLASAYLRQGALGLAEKWALRALSVATTYRTAATEVAAAKVLWQAARQRADRAELDAAVTLLGRAVERRVAELDKNDPEALMLVVDLASAQLAVARSDGDSPRVEQLSEALALAAFRLSAVAGATDPRAIRAATTVALTQFDLAKDDGSAQRIEHSFHQLAALRKRAREVLPPDSPEVLSISLAAVGATVELARANGSHNGLKVSVSALRAATADVETALGPHAVQTLEASANLAIAELDVARALNSPDLVHQAIDQLTAVSQSIETSLGPDHPLLLVLTAASRLAHSLIADHDTDSERSTAAAGTAILVRASAAHWGMDREYLPFERAVSALRSGPASPTTSTAIRRAIDLDVYLTAIKQTTKDLNEGDIVEGAGKETEAMRELTKLRAELVLAQLGLEEQIERAQSEARRLFLSTLRKGQVRTGVVSSIIRFGALVDLGGVNGLVHISELSRKHPDHPSEVVEVGQVVRVEVLDVDVERGQVSLSLKQANEERSSQD